MAINSIFKPLSNFSFRHLSWIGAIISAVLVWFILKLMHWSGFVSISPVGAISGSIVSGFVAYFWAYYVLQIVVFNRLKNIYRLIHEPDKDSALPLSKKQAVIQIVENDVRKWLDQKDRDMEHLEELENYRREYVGNVSHELKTPVFNIQGFLQSLLDGAADDPELRQRFLQKAMHNADRLQTIIEDLEAISRLESRQSEPEYSQFDLTKLAREVMADFEIQAAAKQILLGFKAGAEQSGEVRAERDLIRLVFTNLIQNAIKYGSEKGYCKIGFYDLEQKILVEISDDGPGISEEHLPHIFDRFYRVDKSRSREIGGSGLGLSIVKHIIEKHHQSITVRSTPGQGSTFGFTLDKV